MVAMIQRDVLQKKFKVFIALSAFILFLEVAGGIFTNSLALLSDAGHVLVDLSAFMLAYYAIRLSMKEPTKKFTFGYYRAEILSAAVNGLILVFVTLYIFYEAYRRFFSPLQIKGPEMLAISVIGLIANLYVVIKMHSHEKENLNIRAAYLHALTDTLSSAGVVIAGVLIIFTGNPVFDSITSAIIGLLILIGSLRLLAESAHVLMEAAPKNINLEHVMADIQKMDGVRGVHDLHIWCITSDVYALSSHILIDAKNAKAMNKIISGINKMLKSKYNITHTTIQSECQCCADGKNKHSH
ncbi:MAG: cation diffusion facilitator family transporter [Candidatus Diapherotrites archaeon]|nr:cation diffusion facilitator family transporter [Candidatus Diapherotrites archaeon]